MVLFPHMYYVYILQSKIDASFYTGVTTDLKKRVAEHNAGASQYSSGKRPFVLKWYSCFTDKIIAFNFEKYLKSSSGIAFRNKHLVL